MLTFAFCTSKWLSSKSDEKKKAKKKKELTISINENIAKEEINFLSG